MLNRNKFCAWNINAKDLMCVEDRGGGEGEGVTGWG